MPNKRQLINRLKKLKEMVNQSAEHTQRQLQVIEFNIFITSILSGVLTLLIGSLFSLTLTEAKSFQSKLLQSWIPSSFFLGTVSAAFIMYSTRKEFDQWTNIKDRKKTLKPYYLWLFQNFSPFLEAISFIYGVTLIVLFVDINQWSSINAIFKLLVISVSSLFIILPFFYQYIQNSLMMISVEDLSKEPLSFEVAKILKLVLVFFIVYSIAILTSAYAFNVTFNLLTNNLFFFFIALVLQSAIILSFASYFSAVLAKKEMTNSLTNFSRLNYKLDSLLLNKKMINTKIVQNLEDVYLNAKPYELVVSNYLNFVNVYYLRINKINQEGIATPSKPSNSGFFEKISNS
jgi:hypothetical protein